VRGGGGSGGKLWGWDETRDVSGIEYGKRFVFSPANCIRAGLMGCMKATKKNPTKRKRKDTRNILDVIWPFLPPPFHTYTRGPSKFTRDNQIHAAYLQTAGGVALIYKWQSSRASSFILPLQPFLCELSYIAFTRISTHLHIQRFIERNDPKLNYQVTTTISLSCSPFILLICRSSDTQNYHTLLLNIPSPSLPLLLPPFLTNPTSTSLPGAWWETSWLSDEAQ